MEFFSNHIRWLFTDIGISRFILPAFADRRRHSKAEGICSAAVLSYVHGDACLWKCDKVGKSPVFFVWNYFHWNNSNNNSKTVKCIVSITEDKQGKNIRVALPFRQAGIQKKIILIFVIMPWGCNIGGSYYVNYLSFTSLIKMRTNKTCGLCFHDITIIVDLYLRLKWVSMSRYVQAVVNGPKVSINLHYCPSWTRFTTSVLLLFFFHLVWKRISWVCGMWNVFAVSYTEQNKVDWPPPTWQDFPLVSFFLRSSRESWVKSHCFLPALRHQYHHPTIQKQFHVDTSTDELTLRAHVR